MQSFRTELENPLVEKDIIDLERKIRLFREGKIHEEKFRSLRLARGVYGQRQQGVQMVRIKLPYGKMTLKQWNRIADISDEYSTGNLHFTTRQDVQIHFVSLEKTPELWAKLEQDNITLREACGNTVRNITGSPTAGIDPNEPFDITPYVHSTFEYFLRNPVCQEMGRKFKMSFSNTDADTALSYMHDLGFISKIKDGKRGFKIMLGGGLGAQPQLAHTAYEFLEEEAIIPFIEAVLRVFDRHGERNSRHKARLKFLIAKIGFEAFMQLVEEEKLSLKVKTYPIKTEEFDKNDSISVSSEIATKDSVEFNNWFKTNAFAQKQSGYYGVFVRVPLGNISSTVSRSLSAKLANYIADDVRVTVNQGLLLRFVKAENLVKVFEILSEHNLAAPGANSIVNITACPGTDTCNLAISDSTSISLELEKVMKEDFPELIEENKMQIKISGCMNACGQHSMANIGFHGSSLKAGGKVLPALQVLLGGGTIGNGQGRIADKVIKVPSKRGPQLLRTVLNDYETNGLEGEYFNDYYERQGEKYFYNLLKPLADLTNLIDTDFVDWGRDEIFQTEIGVGECASVIIDLVATLFYESEEKIEWAKEAFNENRLADAIYYAYQSQVNTAKALLLDKNINCSTQHGIISEFDKHFENEFGGNVKEQILQINKNEPTKDFAIDFIETAEDFLKQAISVRETLKLEIA
ncbi:nitrite and sulphite reductase 4Fe-4S region [Emticicia oligotrophica DSM 17448]|uniref:Nitrite and sulphite reductase 4Fe-4S region n=1 Tax=Emticicia oligotrophica (strain DSM 17448 / CIP 109782 / MTCC 6937 / GPTSA100-15) TaxID=929562 RepID=A0ABM5N6F9_EMTOG|nr:HEPN domain-containing protein [Emticicia oligotrophica]AFK05069.1 nitrite and sulphite reductase 4Fe-4S region [Emticicia oligotrophica DSM 17448]